MFWQLVISSAFESSVGLGQYAHLAAAADAASGPSKRAHGLGTSDWFGTDVTTQPLTLVLDGETQVCPALAESSISTSVYGCFHCVAVTGMT